MRFFVIFILRSKDAMLLKRIVILLLLFSGCATASKGPQVTRIIMDVRSYSDPEQKDRLTQLRTFSLAPTDSYDPLKEKELLYLLKNKLISKGYVYTDENPGFVVSINYSIDPVQVQGTTFMPTYTFGTPNITSGYFGSTYFNATTTQSGQIGMVPVPYSDIAYHRAIAISFTSLSGIPLWKGEVESTGGIPDLLVVAPFLVDELLGEFPYKTNKINPRQILLQWISGKPVPWIP